jgi:hypothetical protein
VPAVVALLGLLSECVQAYRRHGEGESSGTATARQTCLTWSPWSTTVDTMTSTMDLRWQLLQDLTVQAVEATDVLAQAGLLEELRDLAGDLQREGVRTAVAAGSSWADVAREVRLTRQGAWSRFSPHATRS